MALKPSAGVGSDWAPGELALLERLQLTARGPKRGGLYALWLTVRTAMDLCADPPPNERAHRRRLLALERRISSIPMPTSLRRALEASFEELRAGTTAAASGALRQLVAPAEDGAGPEAGKAVARAADVARRAAKSRA